jgi:hypothetical protein
MLTVVLDVLVVVGLGALLVGTALYDAGRRFRGLPALHRVGLVPQWSFFAPTPGVQNLYLLYRDVHVGGDTTAWRVVHGMDGDREPWSFIWNPRRRLRKGLHDLISGLDAARDQARPELVQLTLPYLLIVNHISSLPRLDGVWATEFIIMVSDPYGHPHVVYQSGRHRVQASRA